MANENIGKDVMALQNMKNLELSPTMFEEEKLVSVPKCHGKKM